MRTELTFPTFAVKRPTVMVVSHERSGTKAAAIADDSSYDRAGLRALALREVGETMKALGYA